MTVRSLITKFNGHDSRRMLDVEFSVFSSVQHVSNLYEDDGKIRQKRRKTRVMIILFGKSIVEEIRLASRMKRTYHVVVFRPIYG